MATGDLEYYKGRLTQEIERAATAPDECLRSVHITYAELLRAKIDELTSEDLPQGHAS